MLNSIIMVNLATIEDCHQLGHFENLAIYLTLLLDCLEDGAEINLLRLPENSSPVNYGMITTIEQFAKWVEPFLAGM